MDSQPKCDIFMRITKIYPIDLGQNHIDNDNEMK